MTAPTPSLVLSPIAFLVLGVVVGTVHFAGLAWNTHLYVIGKTALTAFIVQFGRLALVAGLLLIASRQGALPLLFGAFGVLVGRMVVLRHARGAR